MSADTFHQLPPFLHGLNAIQTSNSDESVRSSADDAEWFCFEVEEPVRIFLLYDNVILQDHVPAWVAENFRDEHEETGLTDHYYGETGVNEQRTQQGMGNEYEILSGTFPAGRICLGGNGCTEQEDLQHDCAVSARISLSLASDFPAGLSDILAHRCTYRSSARSKRVVLSRSAALSVSLIPKASL